MPIRAYIDYIAETKFATENLFKLSFHEQDLLTKMKQQQIQIEAELRDLCNASGFLSLNPEMDDEGIGQAALLEAHFDVEPKLADVRRRVAEIAARIDARTFARATLCGNVLQIARQGISMVHKGLGGPVGRLIGTQALHDVVWQARNQTLHYEDGRCHQPVATRFEALAIDLNNQAFLEYNSKNLAYEVLVLLKWDTYEQYQIDLRTLLQAPDS